MPVTVHVGVRIGRDLTDQIKRILPAKTEQNRHEHEDADHDAVPHKLVRDHGLHKHRQQDKSQNLREGHKIKLFEILQQLVMVVTRDGLHQNADQHGHGEQYQFHDYDGGEATEPVGGFAKRQSVMDALKVQIALAP